MKSTPLNKIGVIGKANIEARKRIAEIAEAKGMLKVKIKPLSANQLWQGRRFKTKDYEIYEKELSTLLPKYKVPKGRISLILEVGLSNKNADLDNCLKGILDIMQKKYLFNDKHIYKMDLSKRDVKKGEEYIKFRYEKF